MSIQLARKRERGLDKSKRVKAEANSFDVTHFSLWFNSINFCLPRVGVITNSEKADNLNTDIADVNKLDIGKIDPKKADKDKVDGADAERADKPGTSTTNLVKIDEVDKPDTGLAHPANSADLTEANGADK